MALFQLVVTILILTQVSCQVDGEGCVENDVRLVGGDSEFEGRVEICRGGNWERVCGDRWWSSDNAVVVCRQLRFKCKFLMACPKKEEIGLPLRWLSGFGWHEFNTPYFLNLGGRNTWEDPGTGPVFLDRVQCEGEEEMLAFCESRSENINCLGQDAGVECEGILAQVSGNGSVHVTWNILWSYDSYHVLNFSYAINTSGNQIVHSSIVTLPGSESQFEYDGLLPAQNYSICVNTIQWQSTCTSIQIPCSTTSSSETTSSNSETASSTSCGTTEGILGSIIAVLVLLLIAAGVGLAYPRCIRHRFKDKKYLSRISQFLDNNMYLTSNEAYIVRSQQTSAQQSGGRGTRAGNYASPAGTNPPGRQGTREADDQQYAMVNPTPGEPSHGPSSQAIDNIVAQHYEMSSTALAQSRRHEITANEEVPDYSRLEY